LAKTVVNSKLAMMAAKNPVKFAAALYQEALIEDIVESGLRQFLLPVGSDNSVHFWGFLAEYSGSLTLVTDQAAYVAGSGASNWPEDWGGGTRFLHWASAEGARSIPIIPLDQFKAIRGQNTTTGAPTIATIYPEALTPATGQRYTVELNPTPTATENNKVLSFPYSVNRDVINLDTDFLPGSQNHSETIRQSCVAVAELRVDDEAGVQNAKYMGLLQQSIVKDSSMKPQSVSRWPAGIDDPSDGSYSFAQLCREVGKALGFSRNPDTWTWGQNEEVESMVNRGYRRYLSPDDGHVWNFLSQEGEISLASGTGDYDLTADFSGILNGPFHF